MSLGLTLLSNQQLGDLTLICHDGQMTVISAILIQGSTYWKDWINKNANLFSPMPGIRRNVTVSLSTVSLPALDIVVRLMYEIPSYQTSLANTTWDRLIQAYILALKWNLNSAAQRCLERIDMMENEMIGLTKCLKYYPVTKQMISPIVERFKSRVKAGHSYTIDGWSTEVKDLALTIMCGSKAAVTTLINNMVSENRELESIW